MEEQKLLGDPSLVQMQPAHLTEEESSPIMSGEGSPTKHMITINVRELVEEY